MSSDNRDILIEAIARNAAIVLSLPSAGLLRHHKSRFLLEQADGVWVESVPAERPLVEELVRTQAPAGVSFKSGTTKVIFTAPLLGHDPAYQINEATRVEAIRLAFPADINAVQRRNNYRVAIPAGCDLAVKVWRIGDRAVLRDRPTSSQLLTCAVRDISVGGVGVTFQGAGGQPPSVTEVDRLRIELESGGSAFLLEGRMRRPTPLPDTKPDALRTGITFKHLEADLEGRRTLSALTRIVGTLQRDEIRRHRLGIKSA